METKTQHGYLVLADISGFTSYLAATELEHAHEILSELIELIVHQFKPLLTLSKLEGDAVFAYAPEATVTRGETLLELIEATYVAFRDRQQAMHRRTTCTCNACRNIPTLDLKFMAHHGDFILQSVAGQTEVIGSDVNLAHRLMKNHVVEATGWRAYALFTQKCLEHMNVQPVDAHALTENYEHLGDVPTHSLNLQARYTELVEARRVRVTPAEADTVIAYDLAAPPPVVWMWLNEPQKRTQWDTTMGGVISVARPAGRTSAGARNHCMHGKKVQSIETILDWRPFEYYTEESSNGVLKTYELEPTPDGNGTRFRWYFLGKMPMPKPLVRLMIKLVLKRYKLDQLLANMNRLMVAEATREQTAA